MAQLKDTLIQGSARVTDTLYTNITQTQILRAPTASSGTTYGAGTDGQVLKTNGASIYWGAAPATGVTSVQVQASSPLSSSVNTAQTSTLNTTISFATQAHNTVLAGPAGTSAANAAPTFRSLTADDIPTLSASKVGLGNVSNAAQITKATFTEGYQIMYSTAASTPAVLTANKSTTKKFLTMTGASSSAGAAPAWSTIAASDIPTLSITGKTDGTLTVARGGTNLTTITQGGIIYAATGSAYGSTAAGTAGDLLQSNGSSAPSWTSLASKMQDYIKAYEVTVSWPGSNTCPLCNEDEFLTTDTLVVGPGAATSTDIHNIIINASFDFELITQTNGKTQLYANVCKTNPPASTNITFIIVRLRGLK